MIVVEYEAEIWPRFGERLLREEAARMYWLAVRAGVAGRRAEKRDAVAYMKWIGATYRKQMERGDHVGAARRQR